MDRASCIICLGLLNRTGNFERERGLHQEIKDKWDVWDELDRVCEATTVAVGEMT